MPDDLQPDQGQGDAGGGLFDSYLESVPQDQRETVESYLKDASKQVESRLQEAADFRKQWEPYQEVDSLSAYPPEQLSELLAWHQQVTSSEDAFQQWLSEAAKEAGLTPQEEQGLEDAEVQGELSKEEVQKLVAQAAEERTAPLAEQLEDLRTEKAVDYEDQSITGELTRLQKEAGIELSKDQRAMVLDLGLPLAYDQKGQDLPLGDISWVKAGFDRFKEITAQGQKAFVEEKAKAPGTSMSGGGQERFKATTDWGEAKAQALERMRQATQ